MDKEKVLDYVMNSPGNSNRAVLSGMLDESGGGNSDFSTAEVTIINASDADEFDIESLPMIVESEEITGITGSYPEPVVPQASVSLTIPLYKDKCFWAKSFLYTYTGSGNVIIDADKIIITGDCTITTTRIR